MYEIEAKVHLTDGQFKILQQKLKGYFKGYMEKADTYYGDSKIAYLRLRQEGDSARFTLKAKKTERGVEQNMELEWGIKDPFAWKHFLKKTGLLPSARKFKKTELYQKDGCHIELSRVKGVGNFMEIEKVVKTKKTIPAAHRMIINLFSSMGFSEKHFEKRPYLSLLNL